MDSTNAEEFLCKTWIPAIYHNSRFLYAIGNTPAEDLLENYDIGEELDILLLGGGDIRHIIKSTCGVQTRPQSAYVYKHQVKKLSFLMNDIDPVIIARNAIILEAIGQLDLGKDENMLFLWAIWFNMEVSNENLQILRSIIKKILDGNKGHFWSINDRQSRKNVREVWEDWMICEFDAVKVKRNRKAYLETKGNLGIKPLFNLSAVQQTKASKIPKEKLTEEVNLWFETGSAYPSSQSLTSCTLEDGFINPTLMRPGSSMWHLHYRSEPFSSMNSFLDDSCSKESLFEVCFWKFSKQISAFKEILGSSKYKVAIDMCCGDALYMCSYGLPKNALFDLIHTSNLADHLNLTNILMCCAPRLKNEKSVLLTQTMKWTAQFASIGDYLMQTLGCEPSLYPTLYGVNLGEDLDLGKTSPPQFVLFEGAGMTEENLVWKKAYIEDIVRINLKESKDLKTAIQHLAELYFIPNGPNMLHTYSPTAHVHVTPFTLGYVVKRMEKISENGASGVIDIIEEKSVNREFCGYWEVVKSALGYGQFEELLPLLEPITIDQKDTIKAKGGQSTISRADRSTEDFVEVCVPANVDFPTGGLAIGIATAATVTVENMGPTDTMLKGHTTMNIRNYEYDGITKSLRFLLPKANLESANKQTTYQAKVDLDNISSQKMPLLDTCQTVKHFTVAPVRDNISALVPGGFVKRKSVIELIDRYQVIIEVNNSGQQLEISNKDSGELKKQFNVDIVCRKENLSTMIGLKFSCDINRSTSTVRFSSKKGEIRCEVVKQKEDNIGRILLPLSGISTKKLKKMDINPDTQNQVYSVARKMRNGQAWSPNEPTNPFIQLSDSIGVIWKFAFDHQSIIKFSLILLEQKDFSLDEKAQHGGEVIEIAIEGYYWHQGLPFIAVKFLDWRPIYQEISKQPDLLNFYIAKSFEMKKELGFVVEEIYNPIKNIIWQNTKKGAIHQIPAEVQEQNLFRRLLYINSQRRHDKQKQYQLYEFVPSFIQMPFCRGSVAVTNILSHKRNKDLPSGMYHRCGFCCEYGLNMRRCSACQQEYYCNERCQRKHWKTHKEWCRFHLLRSQ